MVTQQSLALILLTLATGTGLLASAEPTVEEVRQRHAASQAVVRTLEASLDVALHYNPTFQVGLRPTPNKESYRIEYKRSGSIERYREIEGPLGARDLIRDNNTGECSLLLSPREGFNNIPQASLTLEHRTPVSIFIAPWKWALFQLPGTTRTLSELLETGEVKAIQSRKEKDRNLVYLDLHSTDGQRFEVWVDPAVNYLARKVVTHLANRNGHREGQILSFQEVTPGVFFPNKLVYSEAYKGKWTTRSEASFNNIQINQPLPAKVFQHVFPPGTLVSDQKRGVAYRIGADQRPTKVTPVVTPITDVPPEKGSTEGTASRPEPESIWTWHRVVLLVSALAVALGVAALLWNRSKSRSA